MIEYTVVEPTSDQCSKHELMGEDRDCKYYAIWYPQMGGYVGHAVVSIHKDWGYDGNDPEQYPCFDTWVWHDGDFPFSDRDPIRLHHCAWEQFVNFGEEVKNMMDNK